MAPEPTSRAGWQHFDHDADVGVRGIGPTRSEAFEQAALALTSIVTRIESVEPSHEIHISAENSDPELLFVDWLDALIFEMATRKMLFSRYEVDVRGDRLSASIWGEPVDVADMKLDDVVQMIRGKAGTIVRLGVMPESGDGLTTIQITREKIELTDSEAQAAVFDQGTKPDGSPFRIGVIDLPSFYLDMEGARRGVDGFKSTTADVRKILEQFKEDDVDAVVLDPGVRREIGNIVAKVIIESMIQRAVRDSF